MDRAHARIFGACGSGIHLACIPNTGDGEDRIALFNLRLIRVGRVCIEPGADENKFGRKGKAGIARGNHGRGCQPGASGIARHQERRSGLLDEKVFVERKSKAGRARDIMRRGQRIERGHDAPAMCFRHVRHKCPMCVRRRIHIAAAMPVEHRRRRRFCLGGEFPDRAPVKPCVRDGVALLQLYRRRTRRGGCFGDKGGHAGSACEHLPEQAGLAQDKRNDAGR